MTTDVELLPLPSPQVPFIDCDPSMTDIRRLVRWYEQGATEYASANVSRATARLQAEIEALRAEVDRVTRENEAMKRCAIRYLEWLGVTHVSLDQALYEDMHNPDMCGDAALTGHHNEVSND